MAFDRTHLSAMAHGDGQTWWQYKSATDTRAAIDTAGYFSPANAMLQVNDLMFVIASDGHGWSVVNFNDGTTVDVTDSTAIGATDTD